MPKLKLRVPKSAPVDVNDPGGVDKLVVIGEGIKKGKSDFGGSGMEEFLDVVREKFSRELFSIVVKNLGE
jgi:hypothetical protein